MPDQPGSEPGDAKPRAAGIDLCATEALEEGGRAFCFDVVWRGQPQSAFVLRHEGQVRAYLNRCAHVPAEMDWNPGEFLDASRRFILCSIHGAAYHPADGRCADGPCGRRSLIPVSVAEVDGRVSWYPSGDLADPFDS